MKRLLIFISLLFLVKCTLISINKQKIFSVYLKPENIYNGEIVILNFENLKKNRTYKLELHSNRIYKYRIIPENKFTTFFLGIPLNSPSIVKLILKENNEVIWEQKIKLMSKKIDISKVIVKQKYVRPPRKFLSRIKKEAELIQKAKKIYSSAVYFKGKPVFPIEGGRITTPFGYKRIYNHSKESIHYGTDIAALKGTPIKSIFAGRVILIGNFYYTGYTVFINHGKGIISMYAHLSKIYVKEGDFVEKSQIIGTVGDTGRVTGPHLHISVYVNQVSVDPMCLYTLFGDGAKLY